MTGRKVITSERGLTSAGMKGFSFDRSMIPAAPGDGINAERINAHRLNAWNTYETLPYPSKTDEAWRRTDIRPIYAIDYQLSGTDQLERVTPIPSHYLQPMTSGQLGGQVILEAEKTQVYLDPGLLEKGVIFTDLLTAERQHPEILMQVMGQFVKPSEGKFAALANALSRNGVLIYVPKGLTVELPLHSILWAPGRNLAQFSQILVWVDEGASLTYLHESVSPNEADGKAIHAGTVEVLISDDAKVHFVEIQSWGKHTWNFTHERMQVGRDAQVEWIYAGVGSRLTKNFSTIDLTGMGAAAHMHGLYFTDGNQHFDHDTQQNHIAASTTSELLFKGVLKDQSRSVWQGMIKVESQAQKSDGYQANRNLTLSNEVRVDSLPGLEILADDVRCTHAATVGNINADELFYLQTRGIPTSTAERVIVEGFLDPILQRILFDGVRDRLSKIIEEKIG